MDIKSFEGFDVNLWLQKSFEHRKGDLSIEVIQYHTKDFDYWVHPFACKLMKEIFQEK